MNASFNLSRKLPPPCGCIIPPCSASRFIAAVRLSIWTTAGPVLSSPSFCCPAANVPVISLKARVTASNFLGSIAVPAASICFTRSEKLVALFLSASASGSMPSCFARFWPAALLPKSVLNKFCNI